MSINTNLMQTELVDSFEIFTFNSEGQVYYYTSYEKNVIVNGITYQSVPIKRSGYTRDIEKGIAECNISAPVSIEFCSFIILYPIAEITVQIRRYFVNDINEYINVFNGVIRSASIDNTNGIVTVSCVSSTIELETKIPSIIISPYCNNSVYDSICALSKLTFTKTITVTFTTDKTILTSLDIPTTNDYYTLGTMEFNNDKRIIVKHTGTQLKLQVPFNGLISGQSVKIIKGCDKTKETCLNTFNNLDNFVGMPYVKSGQNPVTWGLT